MTKSYDADFGVFVVRGQPITEPHLYNVHHGAARCERMIVAFGSSFAAPRWDHVPFREYTREEMLLSSMTAEMRKRVQFVYIKDYGNMTMWADKLTNKVHNVIGGKDARIALVGCAKDKPTGYYLQQFPDWESMSTPVFKNGMSATTFRDMYLSDIRWEQFEREAQGYLPAGTMAVLSDFRRTGDYDALMNEKTFMIDYLKRFHDPEEIALAKAEKREPHCAPYPPSFYTADTPVIQGNKQLMVQRAQYPGKGLWAHPGGHCEGLNALDAGLKELREETGLKVPEDVLRGSIVGSKTYDDPRRSTRLRTVTTANFIHLTPKVRPGEDPRKATALPKVRPSKESLRVAWRDLDIPREEYFEDHWQMTNDALALIQKK